MRCARAGERYEYGVVARGGGGRAAARGDPCGREIDEGSRPAGRVDVVHDPAAYVWRHAAPAPRPEELVLYEMHIGTFSREGTYRVALPRLGYLRELGVTTLALMPVHCDAHRSCWGACLHACSECVFTHATHTQHVLSYKRRMHTSRCVSCCACAWCISVCVQGTTPYRCMRRTPRLGRPTICVPWLTPRTRSG